MNFIALVLLGLMWTVYSSHACPPNCEHVTQNHIQYFKHVSDLQNTSAAPWNIIDDSQEGREPQTIKHAKCEACTVDNMIAKPIFLEITVYKMTTSPSWCKCPYNLAVGCTCVKKEQSK